MRCRIGFFTPPRHVLDYLVVGGGGRGGDGGGGGGGAGGVLTGTLTLAREQAVTVTVGDGGDAVQPDGGDSVLATLTAVGGGSGGAFGFGGNAGGSGGGGGREDQSATPGGAGTDGQGTAGAAGSAGNGGVGGSATPGGPVYSLITGTAAFFGAGGTMDQIPLPPNSGHGGSAGLVVGSGGIVVSGAGTAGANGTYTADGTTGTGATLYRRGATTYYIRNDFSSDPTAWGIEAAGNTLYAWTGTEQSPFPVSGMSNTTGDAPSPSVTSDTTTIQPRDGADGVVVIAFPDDMPALTVGEGLTYDQPTRVGHRVYRFTSGTGTVTFP